MDLKYYREITSSYAKTMKGLSSKDTHYIEKYEAYKLIDNRFNVKKIYYSEGLYSFIILFNTKKDEKEVYLSLNKLKKDYKGMDLELEMKFDEDEEGKFLYTLKIFYESEYEKAISTLLHSISSK